MKHGGTMRYTAILILAFATASSAFAQKSVDPIGTITAGVTTTPAQPPFKAIAPQVSAPGKPQPVEYDFVQVGSQKGAIAYLPEKPRDVLAVPWCKIPGKCKLCSRPLDRHDYKLYDKFVAF